MDQIAVVTVEHLSTLQGRVEARVKEQGEGWQVVSAVSTSGHRDGLRPTEPVIIYMCTIVFRKK